MTDQELQQLAREYANKHLTSGCFNVDGEPRVDVRDLAYFYETLLADIAKTHCIVSREAILSQHTWYMQRMKEVSSARQTNRAKAIALEAAFGTELFEERSEE